MHSAQRISIIGLGKLGASMAAGMASRGLQVIGVDVNHRAVEALNLGKAPVQETGLEEMIAANRERLRGTMSHAEAVIESDISFVIVPTPSDQRGAFSVQYAAYAFRALGEALRQKPGYHVIVLTSTVLPGSTRQALLPILEEASGKRCGPDFGLCYSPEFIALGSVIRDFLNPDFYLIGEFDKRSGDVLESVNRIVSANSAPCKRMSIENAELAKIAVNSFVTLKITYANLLAELCEKIPGDDVDVVSDAIGTDKRIGRRYLTGGMGFGGPCFPRDNVALGFAGRSLGVDCSLLEANDHFNRSLPPRFVERLRRHIPAGSTVAVLGLAYKPFSHVVEESGGIYLARALADAGYRVLGFDPLAGETAQAALQGHVLITDSVAECIKEAKAILITTTDPAFKGLTADQVRREGEQVIVVDFWRFRAHAFENQPGIHYLPIGKCVDDGAASAVLTETWGDAAKL